MDKALELWVRLFDYIGDDPWVHGFNGWSDSCYFCSREKPDHESNCIYIAARELVESNEKEAQANGQT